MNTNKFVRITFALLALAILPQFASAQTYQTWRDPDAATGNWHQANAWWNFPNGSSIVFGQQQWNNNHYTSQTNNNGGSEFATWQWVFQSGASSVHTFGGDAVRFYDNSGTDPMIQNESSATHVINNNISGDGDSADPFSININGSGGLTFGGSVNNQGATINVGGTTGSAATVTFQGNVTGSGGMYVNNGNLTVLFDGTSSQTGQLTINAGTVRLGGSGDTFGGSSQAIRIGTGATLDLNNVSTTVGSIGEEGNSDGGSVSLGSATLTVGGNSYSTFQNGVTGTGSLVKSGSGTLNLYGTVSYSGSTTVNGGVLSSAVAMSTDGVTVSSGTFGTTAADVLGNSVGVTVNGGVYRVGGSDTIGVLSGSGGEVAITNGTLTTSFDGASNNYAGVVSGAGGLTKSGTGTLSFSGGSANSISGGLTVNAGEVVFNKSANVAAVGGAVTVASGATLTAAAANQFGNNAVDLDGTLDLDGNNQSLALYNAGTGTVTLGGATLTNNNTGADTFSGAIAGSGNLVKTGNGTLVLNGGSTYTGSTTVSQGVLLVANNTALGATNGATTVNTGAALQLSNNLSTSFREDLTLNGTGVGGADGALRNVSGNNRVGNITLGSNVRIGSTSGNMTVGNVDGGANVLFVGGTGNTAVSGAIGGAGNSQDGTTTSLFKDGAGTLTLSGANTYSGDTRVTGGRLSVSVTGNLGNGTSDVFVSSGAVLAVNNDATIASLQETGTGNGGTASVGASFTLTVAGDGYNSYMNSISGTGNLAKSGSGTMNLYGTQSRTGTTTVSGGKLSTSVAMSSSGVTVSGGTFETTAADILGNSVGVTVNSGTYSVGGSDTIGVLSGSGGSVDVASGTLTATYDSGSSSYAGSITGTGGFSKAGAGTLTLSGNNSKSGANTVSAGTLVVNGELAGTTTVSSGATLAGSGSVGATTVASGGTISPGNSPGTLSLTNGLTWSGGGNYNWQIYNADDSLTAGLSSTWDLIAVSGGNFDISGLNSGSKFNINLWSLSAVSPDSSGAAINWDNTQNQLWEIVSFTSLNGTFSQDMFNLNTSAINGTAGFANDLNGGVFSLAVDGDSLNLLFTASNPTPSAVPEPGTWAAAAMLASAAGYVRWRRRKQVEPKA